MGSLGFLDGCGAAWCGRVGVYTVEAVDAITGEADDSIPACAYCAHEFNVPAGYTTRVLDTDGNEVSE